MPPPTAFLKRATLAINAPDPTTTLPTGAPSVLLRQTMAESHGASREETLVLREMAALKIRAASQ
jgi:hypothetical protein